MNRIFKKVFNRKLGEYVVASETAKGSKKSTSGAKAAVAIITALVSVPSMAATFGEYDHFAGLNGTEIGQGSIIDPTSYNYYREGWRVGSNATYYNSNVIGTNELNTLEQRMSGLMQGDLTNYSQNIGQANNVNAILTGIATGTWGPDGFSLYDYYNDNLRNYEPNFMEYYSSLTAGYREVLAQQKQSNINDVLNQKIPNNNYYYNSQLQLDNSVKSFGGNNNFNAQSWNYNARSNQNAIALGRDNTFNADSRDTTVIGHDNSLSAITVFTESQYFGSDADYRESLFKEVYSDEELAEFENGIPTATIYEVYNQAYSPYDNSYVPGVQSTIIGHNTVNTGINNIVIGSTTSDRVAEVLDTRQQFLAQYKQLSDQWNAMFEGEEDTFNLEFSSEEELIAAFKEAANKVMSKSLVHRKAFAELMATYMNNSASLAAGVTGNDSISIGVNAKAINEKDAWWNELLAKATTGAEHFGTEITIDIDGNLIDVADPEMAYMYEDWDGEGPSEVSSDTQLQDRTSHNQLAVGFNATSSHTNSVAIGTNAQTKEENSIDFGYNRVTNIAPAINPTDAMTVANLKALEGQFDYQEILYNPYDAKVTNREHVQADVIQQSIAYGKQKDIIMNQELTAYIKDKTDQFVTDTVAENSKVIEERVDTYTSNAIAAGFEVIDETIADIRNIYDNSKSEFLSQMNQTVEQNGTQFRADADQGLKEAAAESVAKAENALTEANDLLATEVVKANQNLNAELDQIADYEDEATDKKILVELIGKTNGKNFGGGEGSTGGDGGSENANGMTDAFEDALNHLQAQDKATQNQLLEGFQNSLDKTNGDFDKQLQDLNIQDQLLANSDAIQDKAYQDGLDLLDAKDKATQLEVLTTAHELSNQSTNDLINQTQTLNNAIQYNVSAAANAKDAEIAKQLATTASTKDKELLENVVKQADDADKALETAVKADIEKGDAQVLANVTDYSNLLNTSTQRAAEAYASEQDKLVYNRMLDVLSAAPSSTLSNV